MRNTPPPSADSPAHLHLASEAGPADGGQAPEGGAGNLSTGYPPAFGQILVLGLGGVGTGGGECPAREMAGQVWPAIGRSVFVWKHHRDAGCSVVCRTTHGFQGDEIWLPVVVSDIKLVVERIAFLP